MPASLLADIVAAVRVRVDDPDARRHDTATVVRYVSWCQRRIAEIFGRLGESGLFENEATIDFTASTELMPLPADFGGLKVVEWVPNTAAPEERTKLLPVRRDQMTAMRGLLAGAPVTAPAYYVRRRGGATVSNELGLLPVTTGTRRVIVTFRQQLADLPSSGLGDCSIDERFNDLLVVMTCLKLSGDDEQSDSPLAMEAQSLITSLIDTEQASERESETEQVGMVSYGDLEEHDGYHP